MEKMVDEMNNLDAISLPESIENSIDDNTSEEIGNTPVGISAEGTTQETGLRYSIHRKPESPSSDPPLRGPTTSNSQERPQLSQINSDSKRNDFNPPIGPKGWKPPVRKLATQQHRTSTAIQGYPLADTESHFPNAKKIRLRILEGQIRDLQQKIARKESKPGSSHPTGQQPPGKSRQSPNTNSQNWTLVQRKRRRAVDGGKRTDKAAWAKRLPGRHKLIIFAADDGSVDSLAGVQETITISKNNSALLSQVSTIGNLSFEYKDRSLLKHNHRREILFSVETPQEAARCLNLGIWIKDRKLRVMYFL